MKFSRKQRSIALEGEAQNRARFVRLAPGSDTNNGTILLADDPRPERRHWAIAHEIGEYTAHRAFDLLGVAVADILPNHREQMANRIANALLLPRKWFHTDGVAVDWDLFELKKIYATASHELIARRMLELTPPVIVTLFDQGKMMWRRSNVLRQPPPLTVAEQGTWRVAHETCQAACCNLQDQAWEFPAGICEMRCWPVHEPDWRREIVRTALEVW